MDIFVGRLVVMQMKTNLEVCVILNVVMVMTVLDPFVGKDVKVDGTTMAHFVEGQDIVHLIKITTVPYVIQSAQTDIAISKVKRSIMNISFKERIVSRDVSALRFYVYRIERLAGAHEQPVSLGPAKGEVGAHLRQQDHTDPLAGG